MISEKVYSYCKDDLSLIENYEKALNDETQTWDCHHRLESDLGLSANELIEQGLYFNRPASELIFMTHSEHLRLHKTGNSLSEETKKKQSEQKIGKKRPDLSGGKNGMFGKSPWNKGKKGVQQAWNKGMTKEEMKNYKKK